ncbi:MAG: hypothetical protein ACRCVV_19370, partial [Shewanella sp.]
MVDAAVWVYGCAAWLGVVIPAANTAQWACESAESLDFDFVFVNRLTKARPQVSSAVDACDTLPLAQLFNRCKPLKLSD